jgi:16S rRNA processing protein RimM
MDKSEYSIIGTLTKLQGYKGEYLLISDYSFHKNIIKWESVFIEIDGLLVPFFISSIRLSSDNAAIIGFERITSSEIAREFLSCSVYQNNKIIGKEKPKFKPDVLNGYLVKDNQHGTIGIIESILDYNQNILFRVLHNNQEILIPANEEFILDIDQQKKEITMQVPEGLLDLF